MSKFKFVGSDVLYEYTPALIVPSGAWYDVTLPEFWPSNNGSTQWDGTVWRKNEWGGGQFDMIELYTHEETTIPYWDNLAPTKFRVTVTWLNYPNCAMGVQALDTSDLWYQLITTTGVYTYDITADLVETGPIDRFYCNGNVSKLEVYY
jgi:hypothetical protein